MNECLRINQMCSSFINSVDSSLNVSKQIEILVIKMVNICLFFNQTQAGRRLNKQSPDFLDFFPFWKKNSEWECQKRHRDSFKNIEREETCTSQGIACTSSFWHGFILSWRSKARVFQIKSNYYFKVFYENLVKPSCSFNAITIIHRISLLYLCTMISMEKGYKFWAVNFMAFDRLLQIFAINLQFSKINFTALPFLFILFSETWCILPKLEEPYL